MAMISHGPSVETILDAKINMLLRITKSIKRGYQENPLCEWSPKKRLGTCTGFSFPPVLMFFPGYGLLCYLDH
jgi:hypothetical protein